MGCPHSSSQQMGHIWDLSAKAPVTLVGKAPRFRVLLQLQGDAFALDLPAWSGYKVPQSPLALRVNLGARGARPMHGKQPPGLCLSLQYCNGGEKKNILV